MNILYILYAILMLAFIIVVHELGHFTVGRLLGIGIDEFSVGFGPKILQKKKNGILYSVRAIIIGGYVRFRGEDEESEDPAAFNNQKVWKRFLTVLAGPAMNFVLAYLVAVMYLTGYGLYETVPQVADFVEGTPAVESGLMPGDIITHVDGEPLTYDYDGYLRMVEVMNAHNPEEKLPLTVKRGDETLELETGLYQDGDAWKMGIYMDSVRSPMNFGQSLRFGGTLMFRLTGELLSSIKNMIFHGEGLDQVSGTVGIVSEVSRTVREGFDMVLYWIMLISANLGIVNLLPLPALDGGRLVFLIVEGIRRKPFSRDKEGLVNLIGLAAFFLLFIVLTWRDIARIIAG